MKQLFLTSSFADAAHMLQDFSNESLTGKKAAFIPTASNPEKVTFYVKSGKKALEKLGLQVTELDISSASSDLVTSTLINADCIYVSGGNTFYLLQELKRTGTDKLIINHINSGKLYIGESAGSIIVSPDISYVTRMDDCKKAPELTDFTSLACVDFYPLPHHTNVPFMKAVEKIIAEYDAKIPLYPFSNKEAITVRGEEVRVV